MVREGLPKKVTSVGNEGARQIPGDSSPGRGHCAKVLRKGPAGTFQEQQEGLWLEKWVGIASTVTHRKKPHRNQILGTE